MSWCDVAPISDSGGLSVSTVNRPHEKLEVVQPAEHERARAVLKRPEAGALLHVELEARRLFEFLSNALNQFGVTRSRVGVDDALSPNEGGRNGRPHLVGAMPSPFVRNGATLAKRGYLPELATPFGKIASCGPRLSCLHAPILSAGVRAAGFERDGACQR